MSERLEVWRDAAIGETREALVKAGRPFALRIARWSDEGRRARWGEIYGARVRTVDRRRRGAFLDLGLKDEQAFLPLHASGLATARGGRFAPREGQALLVCVSREGVRGKGPVVDVLDAEREGEVGRIEQPGCDEELRTAKPADASLRAQLDAAIEEALSRRVGIPGGGTLTIEPTSALVAIDVDAGARAGSGDAEKFALDLNVAAAKEAARQVRLRSLGGLIAIDFVSMRARPNHKALEDAVRTAFTDDPWSVQLARLSRFGVLELARAQLRAPLHEQMCNVAGALSAESLALMALRAVEREAGAHGGRQIVCTVSAEVQAWLDAGEIAWREALTNRIGPRWRFETHAQARDVLDARAL